MAQAKSQSPSTQDWDGVGQSESYQSSGHHGRTHQGQESSTKSGPPRPAPVAVTPTAQAAQAPEQVSGGSAGQSGQHFRQLDEQSWVTVKKVRYSFCWGYQ